MLEGDRILLGKSGEESVYLLPGQMNRHGMIAGASGTGKTATLKVIAESLSDLGVPTFIADVKGDL
ncbi:MAG: helicase HerA-like domain-containing protein, partial [Erysipelotrichaceae bacterium]|nr:helicase HerA-like domain-containing protein [Erysipelotrichaceae bacterium]